MDLIKAPAPIMLVHQEKKPTMIVEVTEDGVLDEITLRKKINVLFDGSYCRAEQNGQGRSMSGRKIDAVQAREEIIKWGETEFGLSSIEKEMISDIYEEIDGATDPTFSREELFKHLQDISMIQAKIKAEQKKPTEFTF